MIKNQEISGVVPRHVDGHSCIEDSIAIIAAFYHRRYEMMFEGIWGFGFRSDSETVGGGILLPAADPERLQKYHGISLDYQPYKGGEQCIRAAAQELACGRPVGVVLDAFFAPWHPSYKVDHILTHLVIVSDINENGDLVCTCGDPMLFGVPLAKELLHDAVGGVVLFRADAGGQKPEHARSYIKNALSDNSKNGYENIALFAQKLGDIRDISDEISMVSDYLNAPLVNQILEAGRTRLKFAEFLDYLYDEVESAAWIRDASYKFRKAATMWNSVRHLLIRSIVSKNTALLHGKVKGALLETADFERTVSEWLACQCLEQ